MLHQKHVQWHLKAVIPEDFTSQPESERTVRAHDARAERISRGSNTHVEWSLSTAILCQSSNTSSQSLLPHEYCMPRVTPQAALQAQWLCCGTCVRTRARAQRGPEATHSFRHATQRADVQRRPRATLLHVILHAGCGRKSAADFADCPDCFGLVLLCLGPMGHEFTATVLVQ